MNKNQKIAVLIGVGVLTTLLFVFSLQGNLQSSLLNDSSFTAVESGAQLPSVSTGTGALFDPFPVFEERDATYRENVLGNSSEGVGLYFSHVYRVSSDRVADGGGSVDIAFDVRRDFTFEQGIEFVVEYPGDVMEYKGAKLVGNEYGTFVIETNRGDGILFIQFLPAEGLQLFAYQELDPFLRLPFSFTNVGRIDFNLPLLMKIRDGVKTTNTLQEEAVPSFEGSADVLYFESRLEGAEGETVRDVFTGEDALSADELADQLEDQRNQPTIEIPQPPQVTTTGTSGTISSNDARPEVTADATRITPASVRQGSNTNVTVTLSISDQEGAESLRSVQMDLSSLGLSSDRSMVQVSTGPLYTVYATSFTLPASAVASAVPYSLPYRIVDAGGNELTGALSFRVDEPLPGLPQVIGSQTSGTTTGTSTTSTTTGSTGATTGSTVGSVTGTSTTTGTSSVTGTSGIISTPIVTQPTTPVYSSTTNALVPSNSTTVKIIDVDVNGDGVVDGDDLELFLEAYQSLTR